MTAARAVVVEDFAAFQIRQPPADHPGLEVVHQVMAEYAGRVGQAVFVMARFGVEQDSRRFHRSRAERDYFRVGFVSPPVFRIDEFDAARLAGLRIEQDAMDRRAGAQGEILAPDQLWDDRVERRKPRRRLASVIAIAAVMAGRTPVAIAQNDRFANRNDWDADL